MTAATGTEVALLFIGQTRDRSWGQSWADGVKAAAKKYPIQIALAENIVTPDQVVVNGKAYGQVNFIAWEQSGNEYLVFDVYVRANLSLIDSQIRALFPKDDIRLSQANGSVVLSGSVADAKTAGQVQSVVEAAGFKTVNMLASPVKSATQIQLSVRVLFPVIRRSKNWLCVMSGAE